MMAEGLLSGGLPIIGAGEAILANVHADDAAGAFVAAAEAGRGGLWHVLDDSPVTVREFLETFAERLGARPPRRVPVWVGRVVAGAITLSFFTQSTRTSNARIRRELGWAPRFPSFREALDQVVEEWKAERQQELRMAASA